LWEGDGVVVREARRRRREEETKRRREEKEKGRQEVKKNKEGGQSSKEITGARPSAYHLKEVHTRLEYKRLSRRKVQRTRQNKPAAGLSGSEIDHVIV